MLDASVAACWAYHDETAAEAEAAADWAERFTPHAPILFWFELRNALVGGERRRRLRPSDTETFLSDLAQLAIEFDTHPDEHRTLALARAHRLSVYDAAYLALALRLGLPLATLDRQLATAARREGARLVD
ncbi:MAG: type II toxin-antitoxin system VapC family toxin [Terriglobales bacterium]